MADPVLSVTDVDSRRMRGVRLHQNGDGTYSISTGSSPRTKLRAVTPNDNNDFPEPSTLRIGTAGNVAIIAANDTEAIVLPVAAGEVLDWVLVKRVLSTGTTSTGIVRAFG